MCLSGAPGGAQWDPRTFDSVRQSGSVRRPTAFDTERNDRASPMPGGTCPTRGAGGSYVHLPPPRFTRFLWSQALSHDAPVPEPPAPPGPPSPAGVQPVPESAPVSEPTAVPEPAPFSEPAPVPEAALVPEAAPASKRRRRGRTTLLIAAAAVLGVLAGGGLGYRVQYERKPTPLPPLTGPALAQPKGPGKPAPVLPPSQDRNAVYAGNLLDLLVPVPKGAKHVDREWDTLLEYASDFRDPSWAFTTFAQNDFQRSAYVEWTDSHRRLYLVRLTQFRDEAAPYTPTVLDDQQNINDADDERGPSHTVPGVGNGFVWGSAKPEVKAGYLPLYEGRGLVQIGNILVEVFVDSPDPVKSAVVMSVTKKQVGRL